MKNVFVSMACVACGLVLITGHAQTRPTTIPLGTAVRVRTIDPISVGSAQPGSKFRGSLADPLKNSAGAVLLPRGAAVELRAVTVTRSGRISGRDKIDLTVDSIAFGGRNYHVVTSIAESKGGGKGKRTLGRTGIGAAAGGVIGGIAGGGTGAVVGALVGGGGGTAVAAATGGRHLTIAPETVLSFQLTSPLRLH